MFLKSSNVASIAICASFVLNLVAAIPDPNPKPVAEANPVPGPQTPTPCPTCGGLLAQLEATCCRDAGCNGYLHCNPTCKCVNGKLVGACNCRYGWRKRLNWSQREVMGSGRFQIILENSSKFITLMLISKYAPPISGPSCTKIFTLMAFNG